MADVTKTMTFGELLEIKPDAGAILAEYGLHCIGCHIAVFETVEQGAKAHGLTDEQLAEMVTKLNG